MCVKRIAMMLGQSARIITDVYMLSSAGKLVYHQAAQAEV
jgi:hypothetical protein